MAASASTHGGDSLAVLPILSPTTACTRVPSLPPVPPPPLSRCTDRGGWRWGGYRAGNPTRPNEPAFGSRSLSPTRVNDVTAWETVKERSQWPSDFSNFSKESQHRSHNVAHSYGEVYNLILTPFTLFDFLFIIFSFLHIKNNSIYF